MVEDALDLLYGPNERPLPVTLGSNALTSSPADTTLTLAASTDWDAVNVSDILESAQERMLVTGKSADATPVFTVIRGYSGTTPVAAATGASLLVNPLYYRDRVSASVQRCFKRPMPRYLPFVTTTTKTPTSNQYYVDLPADTVDVFRVGYMRIIVSAQQPKRVTWFDGWEFIDDADPSLGGGTGKLLTLPPELVVVGINVPSILTLYITYQTAYTWVTGGAAPASEADTIKVPLGAEDIPSLYAAAYIVAGRELSRLEIDKVEEWNHEAAVRQGVNIRIVRERWTEFYQAVEEVKSVQRVPRHRPYRVRRRV
jgi:hypothetical protein